MEFIDAYFEELAKKGIKLTDAQKKWYRKKQEILGDAVKKEYPSTVDEAFEVSVDGFYYATYINAARATKRIAYIPHDPTVKVHTAWDLGFSDSTCIIFFQLIGQAVHIIDFLEGSGKSLADYIKEIKLKDYVYGTHLAPHDIKVREYTSGVSRIQTAAKLGLPFTIVPDVSIQDGIDTVRNMFSRLHFHNSDAVLSLVRHLENYSKAWDKTLGQWSGRPEHDVHSHSGDCIRYMCVGIPSCLDEGQSLTQAQADAMFHTYGKRFL